MGNQIKGCDNTPLKHILTCSTAPQVAHNVVQTYLASKTHVVEPLELIETETNDRDTGPVQIPKKCALLGLLTLCCQELEVVDEGSLPTGFVKDITVLDKSGVSKW